MERHSSLKVIEKVPIIDLLSAAAAVVMTVELFFLVVALSPNKTILTLSRIAFFVATHG